ncbi:MAG TPA: hypothetical protein VMR74_00725 [Gammaproteobacteria bacterium]|nr:hypothetical protein [Gammaproteobacteria bacterium]
MDETRREFLKKAGKVAVYTPPAMLAVAYPSLEAIARSGCNNGVGNGPDCLPPGLEKNGKDFLDNDDVYGTPGNPQNRGGFNN